MSEKQQPMYGNILARKILDKVIEIFNKNGEFIKCELELTKTVRDNKSLYLCKLKDENGDLGYVSTLIGDEIR